jgi:flagellar hook protein FlgE
VPANGTVIADDLQTFTNESIAGGSVTAYDATGNPVNVQLRWAKTASVATGGIDSWQLFYQTNSNATGTAPAWKNVGTPFTFNSSGQMNPQVSSLTLANLTVNGDSLGNVQLVIGSNGLTQFADSSGTAQVNLLQQNGFAAGQLQSIAVNGQNRVVARSRMGKTFPLGGGHFVTFSGTDGLQALNGGAYSAHRRFGAAVVLGDRPDRGRLARSLERRYRHPVQSFDRGAAGLFGERQGDDDRQPDDSEPVDRDSVTAKSVRSAMDDPRERPAA